MSGGIVGLSPSRCSSTEAARALGMRALRDLRELQRIAEQHDVARRGSHRERVGERHLPGLVDDQRVDACRRALRARTATPSRRRAERRRRASANSPSFGDAADRSRCRSTTPVVPRRPSSARGSRTPSSCAACSTSSSRLWIALWLVAVTPTRRPRRMRSMMSRAPVHVLPVPGGPWMKRVARVERSRQRRAARQGRWSGSSRRSCCRRCAAASARGCRCSARIAAVVRQHRRRAAARARRAAACVLYGPPGISARGSGRP